MSSTRLTSRLGHLLIGTRLGVPPQLLPIRSIIVGPSRRRGPTYGRRSETDRYVHVRIDFSFIIRPSRRRGRDHVTDNMLPSDRGRKTEVTRCPPTTSYPYMWLFGHTWPHSAIIPHLAIFSK